MKIFIAGTSTNKEIVQRNLPKFVLESYFYFREWQIPLIKSSEMFLLDSGAYTFMNSSKHKKLDFDSYLKNYISFINKYDIKYFFELDIDDVVGYEKVLEYRKILEDETGKKCIPVWHITRGKDEYINLCENYDYIAIGGMTNKKVKSKIQKYYRWFEDISIKNKTKVHILGSTDRKTLSSRFYSVDSTAWLNSCRGTHISKFINGKIKYIQRENARIKNLKIAHDYNLKEWIKLQRYLELKG